MRALAASALALALGCAPPWIPDGLSCDDGGGCPAGWSCLENPATGHSVCVRPSDAAVPEDAAVALSCDVCPAEYVCDRVTHQCRHPCVLAPGDCPASTRCEDVGCLEPEGGDCVAPCAADERCVAGVCVAACEPGVCSEATDCVDGLCLPLLDATVRLDQLDERAVSACPAGVNADFATRSLAGWCSIWIAGRALPEPRVTSGDSLPLREVIMGRAGVPSATDAAAFGALSLMQLHPLASAEDFDQVVDWDFTAIGSGAGWGVSLSLVFFGDGEPSTYVRNWSETGDAAPPWLLGPGAAPLSEAEVRTPLERAPLSLRDAATSLTRGGTPESVFTSVAIAMSVWTYGPRVELQHRALRVTRTSP